MTHTCPQCKSLTYLVYSGSFQVINIHSNQALLSDTSSHYIFTVCALCPDKPAIRPFDTAVQPPQGPALRIFHDLK